MVRLPTQAELQENFSSSIVEGLGKRHPTEYLGTVSSTAPADCVAHWINRDATEKYGVIIDSQGGLQVMDLNNGTLRAVATPNGTSYITTGDPKQDLRFVTSADYTFIVNRTVTVGTTAKPPTANINYTALLFGALSPGGYTFQYSVTLDGQTVSCLFLTTQSAANLNATYAEIGTSDSNHASNSINEMVSWMAATLQAKLPQYLIRAEGSNTIAVYGTSAGQAVGVPTWTITRTADGINYSAWLTKTTGVTSSPGALAGIKQLFSQLPGTGMNVGDIWKIQGDPTNEFSVYYVKWNGGAWEETTAPGHAIGLDPATMPHVLIRKGDGTFSFQRGTWDLRAVGDITTNPDASFVGTQVRDVTFYRNRLGFVSNSGISFSRAGSYFNFYRESVTTLLDTDPVDIQAASTKSARLCHAVPFAKQLLLFSAQAQMSLTAQETLTPKTGAFNQSTEYSCSENVKPVLAGPMLYFVSERGGYSTVREYYVQQYTQQNRADEVTAHVPSYIPGGVFQLASSPTEDILVALTKTQRNVLYVYQFYWKGEDKAQAAWHKWILDSEDRIEGATLMGSTLYLAVSRPSGLFMERINLQPAAVEADLPFLVHLDRKVSKKGTFNAATGNTTWVLPYAAPTVPAVICGGSFGSRSGSVVTTAYDPATRTVTASGDYSAGPCYIGINYTARYKFSAQFVKDGQGLAIASADFRLRTFSVYYAKTGYFKTKVTPLARDPMYQSFTGRRLGTLSAILGQPALESGVFSFMVLSDSQTVGIELINDSYLPSFFQNAEYEGVPSMRSRRR